MNKQDNVNSPFPSDFVSQNQKKNAPWIMKAAKAAHDQSFSRYSGALDTERDKYRRMRRYADGSYDKTKFNSFKTQKGNKTGAMINWQVSTPATTIVENLVGQFENEGMSPVISCVSPEGQDQISKEYSKLMFNAKMYERSEEFEAAGIDVKKALSGKKIILDQDERKLYVDTSFKDDYSFAMQTAIDLVFAQNKFPLVKRKLLTDTVVCGKSVMKVEYDDNFDIKIRYVDVENHISDYVVQDDYSDAKYQGEYLELTIEEAMAQDVDNKISTEDWKNIARTYAGRNGNMSWKDSWDGSSNENVGRAEQPWGRFKISVLDFEYKSNDRQIYKEKPAKGGGFYLDRVNKRKDDGEYVEKDITNIYKCKWIVDSKYVYDFGLKKNMTREKINGVYSADTHFGFIALKPNIRDGRNTSLFERVIGLIDSYILNNLKAQVLILKARPQGIRIDVSMLGAITAALGQGNIKPKDLIHMMEESSVYYYSSVTEKGTILPNSMPVSEVPESPMQGLITLAGHEQGILKAMEFATGVPLSTIGAPDSDSLVGLQKAAAENRNNATRYISTGLKYMLSQAAMQSTLMIQDSISGEAKKLDDYNMAIGTTNTNILKFTKDLVAAQFGYHIEVKPDAVEEQRVIDALTRGVQAGTIKPSQELHVMRVAKDKPELAERIMKMYEKQNFEEQEASSIRSSQAQSQAQTEGALAVEQAKQKTAQLNHMFTMAQMEFQGEIDGKLSSQEHRQAVNLELVKGDIKSEHIDQAVGNKEDNQKGDLRSTSFPKEAGQIEPDTFPTETQ